MIGSTPEQRTILETELIFGVRRRERIAYALAFVGVLTGLAGAASVALMMPLKQTEAYLTIVDKDTGIAERTVTIENAVMEHSEAVTQSLLYRYVLDRETFDEADNDSRILNVFRRSSYAEREKIKALWTEDSPNFPPKVYGSDAKISVEITNISPISDKAALVRFVKTLTNLGEPDQVGKFSATVAFEFTPETRSNNRLVWENPYGFQVVSYRVAAETLED
ncbi:MAG: virB8 family protein [Hyphomicrobiaceae bacterium]